MRRDSWLIALAVSVFAVGAACMLADWHQGETLAMLALLLLIWADRRASRAELEYHDRRVDEVADVLRDVLVQDLRTADAARQVVDTLPFRVNVARRHQDSGPQRLHGPN